MKYHLTASALQAIFWKIIKSRLCVKNFSKPKCDFLADTVYFITKNLTDLDNQHTAYTRSVSAISDAKIVLVLIKPIAAE